MDTECAVCYSEVATCKLVCKHSFCKSCVKTWYQKSEEPTCPMCRQQINVDVENEENNDDEQTIHMYNEQEEEPYRSELNRYNENNYNFDSEL